MPEYEWGGAEKQFRYFIERTNKNVVLLVEHAYTRDSKPIVINRENILLYETSIYGMKRLERTVTLYKIIKKIILNNKICCALIYDPYSIYLIPFLKVNGIKVIYSERNDGLEIYNSPIASKLIGISNEIVCNSHNAKRNLEKYYKRSIEIIYNGKDKITVNKDICSKINILLVPARITPVKNQMILLKFLKITTIFDGEIIFVGKINDIAYYEELLEFCEENGLASRVRYEGYEKDMRKYYMRDDILVVLPSFVEGMSNVILESFATKTPILVSNIDENVWCDNLHKFSFNPEDEYDLEKCLLRFTSLSVHETKLLLNENYDYITKYHSIKEMIMRYEKMLFKDEG